MLKKCLNRAAFSRQRAFFSPLGTEVWDWSQGATYQLFDIRGGLRASLDPVGTLGLWHGPCGSYLISLQGLALQPLQREKRKKKKGKEERKEGRKEGVYNQEGGGQTGLVSQAGVQDRALIVLWPTLCCVGLHKIPTEISPAFPTHS